MQAYVRRRIQQFNSHPELAQRLGGPQAAAALQAATLALLGPAGDGNGNGNGNGNVGSPAAGLGDSISGTGGGSAGAEQQVPPERQPQELQLVFRHDCL